MASTGSSPKDMHIRVRLGRLGPAAKSATAQIRMDAALGRNSRRGLINQMVRSRITRKVAGKAADLATGGMASRASRMAARGAASAGGLMAGALLAGVLVAGRLATGRSFSNVGENLKQTLLGDLGPQTISGMRAREYLESQSIVLRMAGMRGAVGWHAKKVFDDLRAMEKTKLDGAALFSADPEFQQNDTLDILILRARDMFAKAWQATGAEMEAVLVKCLARIKGAAVDSIWDIYFNDR